MSNDELFPAEIIERLKANHAETLAARAAGLPDPDHFPVVRINGPGVYLITELAEDGDTLIGLARFGVREAKPITTTMSKMLHENATRVTPVLLPYNLSKTPLPDRPLSAYRKLDAWESL